MSKTIKRTFIYGSTMKNPFFTRAPLTIESSFTINEQLYEVEFINAADYTDPVVCDPATSKGKKPFDIVFSSMSHPTAFDNLYADNVVCIPMVPKREQFATIAGLNQKFLLDNCFMSLPTLLVTERGPRSQNSCERFIRFNTQYGVLIKSLHHANGDGQIYIEPKDINIDRLTMARDISSLLYGGFIADRTAASSEKVNPFISSNPDDKLTDNSFHDYLRDTYNFKTTMHGGTLTTRAIVSLADQCVIQPVLRDIVEMRAFMAEPCEFYFQSRPSDDFDGRKKLRIGPDYTIDKASLKESGYLLDNIESVLSSILRPGQSADIFTTKDGHWGIFEYGFGHSYASCGALMDDIICKILTNEAKRIIFSEKIEGLK